MISMFGMHVAKKGSVCLWVTGGLVEKVEVKRSG